MSRIKKRTKRLLTDIGGYGLILLGAASGWLPGPGGIPLVLAGLGLLSVHNKWAHRLRTWLLDNGGRLIEILFPKKAAVEWGYDTLAVLLLVLSSLLIWTHGAIWQISVATIGYFAALFIALMNRDRAGVMRRRRKKREAFKQKMQDLGQKASKLIVSLNVLQPDSNKPPKKTKKQLKH